ncbi:F-box/WD repeat-containing protein 4 [Phymastichus coffea]|uniref:F-box/WD repeat-containing protein 4 n=1 Tax=Phymastichus coffea TaxID=108790 RepID=UPI00273B065E|nr:F-box/WD repeat-containing protein 4 [Phymastichus coffea]
MVNENVEQDKAIAVYSRRRPLRLDELPCEIILLIFDYCHVFDLVRLRRVCSLFNNLAKDHSLWSKRSHRTLATNQVSLRFQSRCNPILTDIAKWEVTHNWMHGRYQKNVVFSQKTKLMPWMQLTSDVLWWSGGNQLCGFERNNICNSKSRVYYQITTSDICKFTVRDEYIITGHRDGSIQFWSKDSWYQRIPHYNTSIENAHSRDVEAVDEAGDIVFSGSADGMVKAWKSPRSREIISQDPLASFRINDRIWSIAIDSSGEKLAVGSAGNASAPLTICDTTNFSRTHQILHTWRPGAGILDMVWENPHTLLTCGYDTCIRKWDIRSGRCVSYWTDPTDATIYSISSDYNNTMVTGTQFNCKAVLWDQRNPQYVQLYFMHLQRMSSPIYSVSFDSSHLYGATDQNVVEVKFTGEPSIKKNYREIMKYGTFLPHER